MKSKLCNEQEKILALEIFIPRANSVVDSHILSESSCLFNLIALSILHHISNSFVCHLNCMFFVFVCSPIIC